MVWALGVLFWEPTLIKFSLPCCNIGMQRIRSILNLARLLYFFVMWLFNNWFYLFDWLFFVYKLFAVLLFTWESVFNKIFWNRWPNDHPNNYNRPVNQYYYSNPPKLAFLNAITNKNGNHQYDKLRMFNDWWWFWRRFHKYIGNRQPEFSIELR